MARRTRRREGVAAMALVKPRSVKPLWLGRSASMYIGGRVVESTPLLLCWSAALGRIAFVRLDFSTCFGTCTPTVEQRPVFNLVVVL